MLTTIPIMVFRRLIMNTYFDHNSEINSNKRIIDAYLAEQSVSVGAWKRRLEQALFILISVLRALTSCKARRIAKATSLSLCLVAFVGIIGAMERGVLPIGAGLLIGLAIIGVELLCLRPHHG